MTGWLRAVRASVLLLLLLLKGLVVHRVESIVVLCLCGETTLAVHDGRWLGARRRQWLAAANVVARY